MSAYSRGVGSPAYMEGEQQWWQITAGWSGPGSAPGHPASGSPAQVIRLQADGTRIAMLLGPLLVWCARHQRITAGWQISTLQAGVWYVLCHLCR